MIWLVKLYEVLPKTITYLGDGAWVSRQQDAKRFASKAEAYDAAEEHGATVVRLKRSCTDCGGSGTRVDRDEWSTFTTACTQCNGRGYVSPSPQKE